MYRPTTAELERCSELAELKSDDASSWKSDAGQKEKTLKSEYCCTVKVAKIACAKVQMPFDQSRVEIMTFA